MNKKPILFSTPMVKAILEGRKTMTRRIINPQPEYHSGESEKNWYSWKTNVFLLEPYPDHSSLRKYCRYKPGDILWVRETWCKVEIDGNYAPSCYQGKFYYYKADNSGIETCGVFDKWRPSIFMPYEAARLFLEVLSVRVERLRGIKGIDAKAEGIAEPYIASETGYETEMRGQFQDLWDSLNAKRGYSWDSNPWVWVIEFKRVEE